MGCNLPKTKKAFIAMRLKQIKEQKTKDIDEAYPIKRLDYQEFAKTAKLRSINEIREAASECRYNDLPLSKIFNFDIQMESITKHNGIMEKKRKQLSEILQSDYNNMQDELWLGSDTEIRDKLEAFSSKSYII